MTIEEKINKKFGKGSIFSLEGAGLEIERFSSGSLMLDRALGGGYPIGRMVEIFGPESSGKSTLALHAVAEMQKRGGRVAFIDGEQALDPTYTANLGVDLSDLYVAQPDHMEQGLEIMRMLIEDGVDLIVYDSTSSLAPRAEVEGEVGDATMGLQARLMSQSCRMFNPLLKKTKTTVIWISQIRSKIGVMWGDNRAIGVGNALKFYASVRMDVSRRKAETEGGVAVSSPTRVKVIKNKTFPPFRVAEINIEFNKGIDKAREIVDLALEQGLVTKRGAWYEYINPETGEIIKKQGYRAFVDSLDVEQIKL